MAKENFNVEGLPIRYKITAIFVVSGLVSLLLVGALVVTRLTSVLSEQTESHLFKMTHQKAKEYIRIFDRVSDEAQGVSDFAREAYQKKNILVDLGLNDYFLMPWTGEGYGSPEFELKLRREKLVLQRIGQILISVVKKNPVISLAYVGTESGIMMMNDVSAVSSMSKLKGYNNTERPWYILAKKKQATIWTEPYVDANTKDLVVTCATPITLDDGTIIGVAGFDVLLSTIQKDILSLDVEYNGYAFLVDNYGKVLVKPDMTRDNIHWDKTYEAYDLLNTGNDEFNAIIGEMIYGNSGLGKYSEDGDTSYLAYAPVPSISASVGIVVSRNQVLEPVENIKKVIYLLLALVFIFYVVISMVIGNNITKPIKDLTAIADRMSKGKLNLDVLPETRKDELGVLIRSINRLIISLKIALERR